MALLHASRRAEDGEEVVLLCDDGPAQLLVAREAERLRRRGVPGSLALTDTVRLLSWAIEAGAVEDRTALRKAYAQMTSLDESLPKDIRTTGLTKSPPWP